MNDNNFDQAMLNLAPDLKFGYSGDDPITEELYNNLKWVVGVDEETGLSIEGDPEGKPTWAELEAELTRLDQEYISQDYARKRKEEYPVMGDQFDMLWHAIDDGTLDKTSDFYTALKAVKDKYPKA